MGIIRVLPETVQNKIAAGEVVERPASVVKELVENAIDAGARTVAVDLEDGGHRLVRVSDDGSGMDEEDLVSSMLRHATSKIRDVSDIFGITSLGFRGEALPSIGSVSRMTIATAKEGEAEGREIVVEAGHIVRLSPVPPRKGTRVEVRDLFFNTPARRKFLRQPGAENTAAAEILTRLALANPEIGFRLQLGPRISFAVAPAKTQLDRIRDIFGPDLAGKLLPFSGELAAGLAVSGHFARPPEARHNSTGMYIIVNRRWIRCYALAKAVADVFKGIIPQRKYPFAVINLTVDPARVDVNVHPTKEEVRFDSERVVISGVVAALRKSLARLATLPTAFAMTSGRPAGDTDGDDDSAEFAAAADAYEKQPQMPANFLRARQTDFSKTDFNAIRRTVRGPDAREMRTESGEGGRGIEQNAPAGAPEQTRPEPAPKRVPAAPGVANDESARQQRGVIVAPAGRHRVLGQIDGKYIAVSDPDGFLLIDPHALHERWNYDRLVEERRRGASSRKLLLPVELRLSPAEAAAAVEAVPALAEYGFEFTMPGHDRMAVMSAPSFINPGKLEELLRQVLADVGAAKTTVEAARERLLASLACRSSVLLGKSLSEEEIVDLLDRFFNQGQLPTCPHGRPTAIRISWEELARRFGR